MMHTRILTFYRFIAATMVVIFHFGQNTSISKLAPGFFNSGPEMVTFFFVLSGFIMALTCLDQPTFTARSYWLRRFSKIYPAYIIAAIIMMLFFGNKDGANDSTAILLHITMLQSWVPDYPLTVNVPAWSLSIEAFFYALFPAILYGIRKYQPDAKRLLLFSLVFWLATQALHLYLLNSELFSQRQDLVHFIVWYFPLSHLCSFVLGIAGYYFMKRMKLGVINHALTVSALSICVLLAFKSDISTALGLQLPFESSLLSPLFLLLILASVQCKNRVTDFFSRDLFFRLGEASYAVYILQKPIRSLYLKFIYPTINTSLHIHLPVDVHFLMYFVVLVLVSLWITAQVESPVKNRLRKTFA